MLPVGSIIASILNEADFKRLMQAEAPRQIWELAKGQAVPQGELRNRIQNSADYSVLNPNNVATLPDFRGMFLRGLQSGRPNDGKGDDESTTGPAPRKVGSFQEDSLKKHTHVIGNTYPNYPNAPDQMADNLTHTQRVSTEYPSSPRGIRTGENDGGVETRPRNVAVNYYVRVA